MPAGQATAALDIAPYHELEVELRPQRAAGGRKASSRSRCATAANAPVEVALGGLDPEDALQFAFQKPRLHRPAGPTARPAFTVRPPKQILFGRPVDSAASRSARARDGHAQTGAPPQAGLCSQKPWLPWWALDR